ncbi:MAG: carboxymuconolactone decarboxylase family protein, partial [Ardenticatenia bacterium]|nr:carboxymuconolactone decarboxylase family protein [Ardenticatenia bacterium]
MARVSLVEKEQADPIMKDVYQRMEDQNMPVLNLFKVLAHCPYIGRNWMRLGNSILRAEDLSPKLRQLAILRVGHLAQSEYEFTKHVAVGLRLGVRREQIDASSDWATATAFNDEERAVLGYT